MSLSLLWPAGACVIPSCPRRSASRQCADCLSPSFHASSIRHTSAREWRPGRKKRGDVVLSAGEESRGDTRRHARCVWGGTRSQRVRGYTFRRVNDTFRRVRGARSRRVRVAPNMPSRRLPRSIPATSKPHCSRPRRPVGWLGRMECVWGVTRSNAYGGTRPTCNDTFRRDARSRRVRVAPNMPRRRCHEASRQHQSRIAASTPSCRMVGLDGRPMAMKESVRTLPRPDRIAETTALPKACAPIPFPVP